MDTTFHNYNLLHSKLKSKDEMIRGLKAQMELDFREYSNRIEELKNERDALLRERDTLRRDRDLLRRENRDLKLENLRLKSECQDANMALFLVNESACSAPSITNSRGCEIENVATKPEDKSENLVEKLLPFFINEDTAERFLNSIQGRRDTEITNLVNHYWEMGAIRKKSRKTHLWRVLSNAKIYTAQESNWNALVDFKKR